MHESQAGTSPEEMPNSTQKWDSTEYYNRQKREGESHNDNHTQLEVIHKPNLGHSLREMNQMTKGVGGFFLKQEIKKYFNENRKKHIEILLTAQLNVERAQIGFAETCALDKIKEMATSHFQDHKIRLTKAQKELVYELEELFKEWFLELSNRDMPKFMRETQTKAIIGKWEEMYSEAMGF